MNRKLLPLLMTAGVLVALLRHVWAAVNRDLVTARGELAGQVLDGGLEAGVRGRDAAGSDEGDLHALKSTRAGEAC